MLPHVLNVLRKSLITQFRERTIRGKQKKKRRRTQNIRSWKGPRGSLRATLECGDQIQSFVESELNKVQDKPTGIWEQQLKGSLTFPTPEVNPKNDTGGVWDKVFTQPWQLGDQERPEPGYSKRNLDIQKKFGYSKRNLGIPKGMWVFQKNLGIPKEFGYSKRNLDILKRIWIFQKNLGIPK